MEKDILVIGNGFDIAHGLDTKYEHFIKYIREENYKSDEFLSQSERAELTSIASENGYIKYLLDLSIAIPGWVDLERELYKITCELTYFISNYREMLFKSPANQLRRNSITSLLMDILINLGIAKWVDGNVIVDANFYHGKYGLNKVSLLNSITKQLDTLIRALEIYLLSCQRKFEQDSLIENKCINQIADINPSYIISFNYTNTYKIYGIADKDVYHVHGKLEKKNMVVGFDDTNSRELDFIFFKKYFQRIQKLTGYIDEERFVYEYPMNKPTPKSIVHFYGHSLDRTDEDIIKQLEGLSGGFIIYTYDDNDYAQKVMNLIDIFGKDKATKMIQLKFIKFQKCL